MPSSVDMINRAVDKLEGQYDLLTQQLVDLDEREHNLVTGASLASRSADVLHNMETNWREQFQQGLAAVVSDGLTSILGTETEITLETSTYRDATSIEIKVTKGGVETEVEDARGGTLIQPLAFLLRVLLVVSVQPSLRPILVLDEPFAHVSKKYRSRVAELLVQLSSKLGMQFLIIAHDADEYLACADKAYVVEWKGESATLRDLREGEHE